MIFYLVGILLIFYSFYDYKKSFFLFVGFKFFLNTNITLVSVPGIPQLSLDLFMTMFYYLLFLSSKQKIRAKISFPLLTPFIALIVSGFLSMIFAQASILSEFSNFLKVLFLDYIVVLMVWNMIEDKTDFERIFSIVTLVILISCAYGLYEFYLKSNPLTVYEMTLNRDNNKVINVFYEINARGYRINSIFEHCIGAGITWGIYVIFVLYGYVYYRNKIQIKPFHFLVAGLALICLVLTKMRSTLVFIAIGSLGLINLRKKRFYVIFSIVLVSLIIVAKNNLIPEEVIKIVKSITSKEFQTEISGSSIEMRFDQFLAAFELLKINPIFGLGDKFQQIISNSITSRLRGSESIWLMVITRNGIIGIISTFIYFYYMVIKIPKRCNNKNLFWLGLAYFVTYTITSIPGTIMCWFYIVYSFFVKNSNKYQKMGCARVDEWRIQGKSIIHKRNVW